MTHPNIKFKFFNKSTENCHKFNDKSNPPSINGEQMSGRETKKKLYLRLSNTDVALIKN